MAVLSDIKGMPELAVAFAELGVRADDLAGALARIGRAEKNALQDAAPKPWIVDVAQQYRPKRTRGHRRVK